jgi:hypothetical protein
MYLIYILLEGMAWSAGIIIVLVLLTWLYLYFHSIDWLKLFVWLGTVLFGLSFWGFVLWLFFGRCFN